MSKRTKVLVAGAVTMLATSLGVAAPAVGSAASHPSLKPLMDHSWCC